MIEEEHIADLVSVKLTVFKPVEVKAAQAPVIIIHSPGDLEDPSLMTKAGRLRRELVTWGKGGFKLAPKGVRKARMAICMACEYFDPSGNMGMGQCRAPGCGCTKVKAALATSVCPKKKWAS